MNKPSTTFAMMGLASLVSVCFFGPFALVQAGWCMTLSGMFKE